MHLARSAVPPRTLVGCGWAMAEGSASGASGSSQAPPFPRTSNASQVTPWVRQTRQRLEGLLEQEVLMMESRGALRYFVAAGLQDHLRRELVQGTRPVDGNQYRELSEEELRQHMGLTTLAFCRNNLGMKSAWWEPQMSSIYILGRPVQVPSRVSSHGSCACARSLSPFVWPEKSRVGP